LAAWLGQSNKLRVLIELRQRKDMAYDLEEQERLAELKAWWSTYGKWIVSLLLAVLLGVAAWRAYSVWGTNQAIKASALYAQLQTAVQTKDKEKIAAAFKALQSDYASTQYAAMAALLEARYQVDEKNLASARATLEWAVKKTQSDELRAIAALRLAGLLLDEKQFDQALKVLDGKVPEAFISLYADRRGDIYVAQNKMQEARKEFRLALEKLKEDTNLRQIVEIKLDALGEV
jgi:predicted negative regulator of RcsB-dependent stress response